MAYFSEEDILEARKLDLLTYLKLYEPRELVRVSGNTYSTREHGSLKISNGKWMWWSHRIGGVSALDYLIKVRGIPFPKAVKLILGRSAEPPSVSSNPKGFSSKKVLLPDKNGSNEKVIKYLTGRGIHPKLIKTCIEKDFLYESLPYHNCVFLGYDEEQTVRYAYYRSTNSERIMGEATGSDKHFSFRIDHPGSCLHVFESAIDLLSFATKVKIWNGIWPRESMLSLGGVYVPGKQNARDKLPAALAHKLETAPDIRRIVLHLDNDAAGKSAAQKMITMLGSSYDIHHELPGFGKDVNDELLFLLRQLKENEERMKTYGRKQDL